MVYSSYIFHQENDHRMADPVQKMFTSVKSKH